MYSSFLGKKKKYNPLALKRIIDLNPVINKLINKKTYVFKSIDVALWETHSYIRMKNNNYD